jgi:hypothetical protein
MKRLQAEWNRGERRHGRLCREGSGRTVRAAPEIQQTTAKNLEEKFDRGDEVLDYFDVRKARVITPSSKGSAAKAEFAYPARKNSKRAPVVREKSARYRKKR